ncbi:MAG: hypothetical protein ACREK3_10585 [Gemmatimonadota bacterium]
MSRRARATGAGVVIVLAVVAARPSPAQDTAESATRRAVPALTLYEAWAPRPRAWSTPVPEAAVEVDVGARFEAFQREFAEDFGAPTTEEDGDDVEDIGTRVGEAFVARWEGSRMFRWYERLVGVYDRFEGLYQRLETSTRWATHDFSVDPDLEAAVDGKLRLAVERRVAGFDMGVRVDDAINGRLGLRLGGVIRGYKFGFDVSDVMNDGRFSLQVRKTP